MDQPLFSLILATINRIKELDHFLNRLQEQNYLNFEVILIDQNEDDRLFSTIEKYKEKIKIIHLISEPGLSKARNIGLLCSNGEIIAFPDDDCWYPPDLLSNICRVLEQHPEWDGITGVATNGTNEKSRWKWDRIPGRLTVRNVWQRGISITLFLRRGVIDKIGSFDEEIGRGASTPWQSGEETDFLIRAIRAGFQIEFLPNLQVYHDCQPAIFKQEEIQKAYFYGCGMGHVLRKQSYPFLFSIYTVFRPFLIAVRAFLTGHPQKASYFAAVAHGRWKGLSGK